MGVSPAAPARLVTVDALRGVAALAVLLLHIPHSTADAGPVLRPVFLVVDRFHQGVWLFMVISGFCIHLSAARVMASGGPPKRRWGAFWRRRMVRLYPAYLAAVALGLVVYAAFGPSPRDPFPVHYPWWDVAAHLFMVHHLFVEFWGGVGNGPLWTLGVEEHLYALYAVYLLLRRAGGVWTALGVVSAVTGGWYALISWRYNLTFGSPPLELGQLATWPFRFWLMWCLGAVAAEVYAGAVLLPRWLMSRAAFASLFVLLAGTYFALAVLDAPGATVFGGKYLRVVAAFGQEALFGAVTALGLVRWARAEQTGWAPGRATRALAAVGVFSYSLYITHAPAIRVLEVVAGVADGDAAAVVRYLLWPPACVGFAYLFFLAVEKRFAFPAARRPGGDT